MKKLPEITMKDWLEAEELYRSQRNAPPPQPKGSVTVKQFAELTGYMGTQGARTLREMVKSGMARREKWNGSSYVYFLNKK